MEVLVYSKQESERLYYTLDFILDETLGINYQITTDKSFFLNSTQLKINYSDDPFSEKTIQILPHAILFEKNIQLQTIKTSMWQGLPIFFSTTHGDLPFDIFAASFYLVSRYEEYLSNKKDEFNRFPHTESLAFKQDFLSIPLVDNWLLHLKEIFIRKSPSLLFQKKSFRFIPTYDIDIAFSYRHKGILKNIGGLGKNLLQGNFSSVNKRVNVLLNRTKDPYDSFDFLDQLHSKYSLSPIYFFLVGGKSRLDKPISLKKKAMRNLIQKIAATYKIGLHPSYASSDYPTYLPQEKKALEQITLEPITRSRQHYIRFTLPETYQGLLQQGIASDYSMGYGSINGFRASTAQSFLWFDLTSNKKTSLRIYPFCYMECNSFFEQKQSALASLEEVEHYIKEIKKVNGLFISIWHNFSLGTDVIWEGWKDVYLHLLEEAVRK